MRKVVDVTISAEGRDQGKTFRITEMPAAQAEEWAMRAFLAMTAGGMDLPEEAASQGLAGVAAIGLPALGKIPWDLAKPLLDEMMGCVQSVQRKAVRALVDDDIEEISTRLELRKEVIKLHFDFFPSGGPSTSDPATPQPAAG